MKAVKSILRLVGPFLILCICTLSAYANQKDAQIIRVWDKNYDVPAVRDFIQLALDKAKDKFGTYQMQRIVGPEQGKLLDALAQDQLVDIAVSAVASEREAKLLPIYIPLDRGLLGFRACLINKSSEHQFSLIQQPSDFSRANITIAIGSNWPDRDILAAVNLPLVHKPELSQLYQLLRDNKADCISRSFLEIGREQAKLPEFSIEPRLALVYPLADIIYVRPGAPDLYAMLNYGLNQAVADNSYYQLFDKHYEDILAKQNLYNRKLLIMYNPNLSKAALKAINQFGLASFAFKHENFR